MSAEPATHLICAGATKAGTSWLHGHLAGHPECSLRSIKELHFFDTVEHNGFERQIRLKRAELAALVARGPGKAPRVHARRCRDLRDWLELLERRRGDVAAYLAYLADGRGARRLLADITPAYGLLPAETLRRVAGMAADVRFVYLLREPVSRLWSHVRMLARRKAKRPEAFAETAHVLMERALNGDEKDAVIRGDYAGALARLDAAVAPQRLLVLFMEELLSPTGIERLSGFLGIAPREADFGRRAHEGVALPLDEGQRARAVALLRPQYDAVAHRFGALPESWRRSLDRAAAA